MRPNNKTQRLKVFLRINSNIKKIIFKNLKKKIASIGRKVEVKDGEKWSFSWEFLSFHLQPHLPQRCPFSHGNKNEKEFDREIYFVTFLATFKCS